MSVSASTEFLAPTLVAAAPATHEEAPAPRAANAERDTAAALVEARADVLAGRYRMDAVLAEGGMATVFRAWHCLLEQPVALKMLRPEYCSAPEIAQRFLDEARAVARLRSKHAVRVMDFGGTADGNRYMVLELLNGKDLQQLLTQQGALPVERAVGFVLQAAEAVAEAHATGLVHRDIKPANLFLAKEDGSEIIKVIDFGICKSLCRKSEYRTLSKSYLGSPQYMSPEQIQSAASVDTRTDIWSLGVVLYELLTGRPPFRAATLPALCASVMTETPIWPEQLPRELGRIVMRCLAKKREDRYATVAGLAADLARFRGVSEPSLPGSGVRSAPGQSSQRARSRVVGWFRKALVCGGVTGVTAVLGWSVDAARDEASATQLSPTLTNVALAASERAQVEPAVEPVQPVAATAVAVSAAVALSPGVTVSAGVPVSAAAQRLVDGEPPAPAETTSTARARTGFDKRAARATSAEAREPSTLDMEARYALTYQPDVSSPEPQGSEPDL